MPENCIAAYGSVFRSSCFNATFISYVEMLEMRRASFIAVFFIRGLVMRFIIGRTEHK